LCGYYSHQYRKLLRNDYESGLYLNRSKTSTIWSTSDVLDIHISDTNRVAVVEAQGRIDSNTAHELGSALNQVIDDGYNKIVLDLAGVDYMSSAGLRELVAALKKVQNMQGDIRISRVTERVYEVMEIPGLHQVLRFFDSQAEAVNSF